MPFKIVIQLCLFIFSCSATALQQKVILSMDGKSELQLRIQAKNQAVLASLERLPAIIWGRESLSNDELEEQIQTIGYAHADVSILSETFDQQAQRYTLIADVRFDEAKINKVLKDVADGQFAVKTLDKIHNVLKGVDIQRYLESVHQPSLPPFVEAQLFTNPYFYAQTHLGFVEVHEGLVTQFAQLLMQQKQAYLSQFSDQLTKVTKDHFIYQLLGPEVPKNLVLSASELQALYDDYADEIQSKTGGICLFSPLVNRFFRLPQYKNRLDMTLSINPEYAQLSYLDLVYRQEMQAVEFVYCDENTIKSALPLRKAHPFFMKQAD